MFATVLTGRDFLSLTQSPNHDNRYVCLNIFIYLLGRHNLEMQFNKNKETPYKATYLYFIIYFLNSEQSGTLVM